jgi:hypothetical protein
MRTAGTLVLIFFFVALLLSTGCEPPPPRPDLSPDGNSTVHSAYAAYAPVKLYIAMLTDFVRPSADRTFQIRVYVHLLDPFDCQIKAPGVFRFELYEFVQRSSEPKGARIAFWDDIDLTDPAENNGYWRDYFRAYEFNLDFDPQRDQCYILQATCLCPNGRRLSDDFVLTCTE